MAIDSFGNISGGWGGISGIGSSGGLTIGGITIPSNLLNQMGLQYGSGGWYSIPGWTASQNAAYNNTMTDYNSIEAANKRQAAQFAANQLKNYEAMAAQQDAQANSAIQRLYQNLNTVNEKDDFLSGQIAQLSAAGVDTSTLASYAAAGAKAGVNNYATVAAQAKAAMKAQQDYLDYIQTPMSARNDLEGQDKINSWYSDIASKDINGTYATALRNTVSDLVNQLTGIQQARQTFAQQTSALAGAAQIASTAKTAQALMGIDTNPDIVGQIEQAADVSVDVSHQNTNESSRVTPESRGGGRYVTTTAKNASGLRI